MTTEEDEKEWLGYIIVPQNDMERFTDKLLAQMYHQQILHAEENRQMERHAEKAQIITRPLGAFTRRLAGLGIKLRPGLKEFLDERHAWQAPHRYSRYPISQ